MRNLSCNMLLVIVFWYFGLPAIQNDYSYELRGRVTDEAGRPVAGALVFLDPPKEDDQVFGFTTDGDGTFHIRENTAVPRSSRLLYVTGPIPGNTVELIAPPFNLLPRITERRFGGKKVSLNENGEVDLGDVPIQVRYSRVIVYLRDGSESPLLTSEGQWRDVWLRLRDLRGRVIQKTSLSHADIKRAVSSADASIAVSVPQGHWSIEASVNGPRGPWLRSSDGSIVGGSTTTVSLKSLSKRN